MQLTKYITKSCIVPNLLAANKSEALRELTQLLFERKKLKGVSAALDQIMAREMTESTGIGHGIAVPHARVSGLKQLMCAVGRVNGGLDFMAVDRKPVYLVFLICYPPAQQTTYLNFVATIARLLRDDKHAKLMMAADNEDDIFDLLDKFAKSLSDKEEKFKGAIDPDADITRARNAHTDVILLARLQLLQEIFDTSRTGKKEIKARMERIRALVTPSILKQFDKLTERRPPALVPVEADTCQGCFMKLPSQYAQRVRQDPDHLYSCTNCSRFIYMV